MEEFTDAILDEIKRELDILWAAHKRVGLEGYMCLYTLEEQDIWRANEGNLSFWFGPGDTQKVLKRIKKHYNNGSLPNAPLLLSPIVHQVKGEGKAPEPVGSGFAWSTSFCLGIDRYSDESALRLKEVGAMTDLFHRGENEASGLKSLLFADRALEPSDDGAVEGCRELYELAYIRSENYYPFYLLSGLEYLSKNGMYGHPKFTDLLTSNARYTPDVAAEPEAIVKACLGDIQQVEDAAKCWQAYDNHHSLFRRFGVDVANLDDNLKYYRLCGRDFELLDATGPKHVDADTEVKFEFLVEGWIAKGAVTVIGATGGTGKSSLAHNLAIKAAIDYEANDPNPTWLGSNINLDACKGMCIYFSGEDGPAIVHSRAKIYDPDGRAQRIMFLRTDLGEGITLARFLRRLEKLPEVPLIVIDPARKYLTGDENDAGVVSEFFEAIEEFAINKNTAMVVVHHLAKGAHPENVLEIYDLLRGSQVFIDRPRAVIGMYREGPNVVAGLAKNNIPPQLGMVQGERVFVRDAEHLELVWLPGEDGVRTDEVSEEELKRILKDAGQG